MKTTSPWLDLTPDKPRFPALSGRLDADVIVIGAGMVGVMAAWRLAESGKSVVLLEKNQVASGETAFTTGFITRVPDANLPDLEKAYGAEFVSSLFKVNARAQQYLCNLIKNEKIECGFAKCASYSFAYSPHDRALEGEWGIARRADRASRFIRGRSASKAAPPLSEAVCYGGEARFDARRFILALLSRPAAKRIRVFENSEALNFSVGDAVSVKTSGGEVTAGKLIVASGLPVEPFSIESDIASATSFIIAAKYAGRLPISDNLFWDNSEPYFYFRRLDSKTLLLGGADLPDSSPIPASPHAPLESFLRTRLGGSSAISYKWAGRIHSSPDGLPYVSAHPKFEQTVFVATAFGGNGMVMGTAAGLLLADLAIGRKDEGEKLFSLSRGSVAPKNVQTPSSKSAAQPAQTGQPRPKSAAPAAVKQKSPIAWLRSVSIYKLVIYMLVLAVPLGLLALPQEARLPALATLSLAVLAAVLSQFLLSRKSGAPLSLSEPALISGIIIGSALAPNTPPLFVVLICAFAMLTKRLLRVRHVPLFNSAALGLLAGSLLLGTHNGWWASNYTPLLGVWLALCAFVLSWKLRRLSMQFAFLAVWLALWGAAVLLAGNVPEPAFFLESIPLYFLAFMLLEHTTSPMRQSWQILYGALVAAAAFAVIRSALPIEALLIALLAGNVLTKLLLFLPVRPKSAGAGLELCLGKADLSDGTTRCVSAGGRNFSIAFLGGKYYCVDNACTHMGGPLCKGSVGELNGFTITCPWHNSVFDMRDGQVLRGPASASLRRYDVSVRKGLLYISA